MKQLSVVVLFFLLSSICIAQERKLPEILNPGVEAEVIAKGINASVFKLLPRGKFENSEGSYEDKDNPLGIRGGGAYYSFTTGLHSYNKVPQIELQQNNLSPGFYGLNYGLMIDLGDIPLESVAADQPQLVFLSVYHPPHLIPAIREEQGKRGNYTANNFVYRASLPAIVGNTYILRAINYDEADELVAFKVLQKSDDGGLTLAWRKLSTFKTPKPWYSTDEEMNAKLSTILAEEKYTSIRGEVKNNEITLTLTESISERDLVALRQRLFTLRPIVIHEEFQKDKISKP